MSSAAVVSGVCHSALDSARGHQVLEVQLSDRQRVALVLQAAALLSHLTEAGWRLTSRWEQLAVDEAGVLRGARAEPGSDAEWTQRSLTDLLLRLFRSQVRVAGRGPTRRIADHLRCRWQGNPWPLSADRIVSQVLDSAPFLWQPAFAAAREALGAEIVTDAGSRLSVAGRGSFESRLLGSATSLQELVSLLTGRRALELWTGLCRNQKPAHPPPPGQRHAELMAWRAAAPRTERSRLAAARALHAHGCFEQAGALVEGLRSPAARLLRADCRRRCGHPATARRLLGETGTGRQSSDEFLSLAELAVGLCSNLDDSSDPSAWVGRALRLARGAQRPRAELLAAEAAWQGEREVETRRRIRAAAASKNDPRLAWRWYRLRALDARSRADLAAAEEAIAAALRASRQILRTFEAAELWQQMSDIRMARSDLAGAERAANHVVRLLDGTDCGRQSVFARQKLLEIRLRRGLVTGSRALPSDEAVAAGVFGDPRGVRFGMLWARYELVRGRPAEALRRLRHCESGLEERGRSRAQSAIEMLSARALSWLGRGEEHRDVLASASNQAKHELEPEELPALWALAGDWRKAIQVAGDGGLGRLWRCALSGAPIPEREWDTLLELEPYRAARFIFDFHLLVPGVAPTGWLQRAATELRGVGADSFAERLEPREGAWRALESYLEPKQAATRSLAALFTAAGYFDARLCWRDGISREQVLVPGKGGGHELSVRSCGGRMVLRAATIDTALRALFALAARDFRPRSLSTRPPRRTQGIVGDSDLLQLALDRIEKLSGAEVVVLIQGETGTGKELAARQLHALSLRASKAFVAVNCAALSESLLLSELFGHVRGAFTGADRDRAGIFESAHSGTVFLDEIGDLPLAAQGKLLRVLHEGEIRRVGESLHRRIDVRVLAATHRNLRSMVAEGRFRQDLYYRLSVGSVSLPPLRERGHDVLLLADHFLSREGYGMTSRAKQRLLHHRWPGNVRELRNVLQVAMVLADRSVIDSQHLELPEQGSGAKLGYHHKVEEFRRGLVREALDASEGNRAEAARRLDLSRQALSYLVRRLGVT